MAQVAVAPAAIERRFDFRSRSRARLVNQIRGIAAVVQLSDPPITGCDPAIPLHQLASDLHNQHPADFVVKIAVGLARMA